MLDRAALQKAIADAAQITVRLKDPEEEWELYPVRATGDFLLAAITNEMALDGWMIVPHANIASSERTKFNEARTRMMRADGALERLEDIPAVDLASRFKIFNWLRTENHFAVLSALDERFPNDPSSFQIGAIVETSTDEFSMHAIEGDGTWDSEPSPIQYSEVLVVRFLGNYESVYQRQMPPLPKRRSR